MWQPAAFYLCLLIVVHQSLADFQDFEIQKKLDGIRDQNTALQESLKTIITKEDFETRLQVLQNQLDGEFLTLQTRFKELQNKLPQKGNSQHIPPKFEQIGSRYFYIENDIIQDWATAGETCRQMGGYLASIQDEVELNAIKEKLSADSYYWLGIHNRGLKEDFMSLASGKPAIFLKWHIGYPRGAGTPTQSATNNS
ncbi:uncharacterized protein LOC119558474 [Drosophila subpulchrella]|uniref:uncharacterized protein LOC119555849 n=1 Tax=Drosophila subpulchrella TaxID=1486046 RepID=UPI0018A17608|nr:uncharacterized protein LOC119555849 [Drosophila subpulchrella]XP_037727915.1 uncharacterized protein LOC119558474 [Drosophila subpulchrella]